MKLYKCLISICVLSLVAVTGFAAKNIARQEFNDTFTIRLKGSAEKALILDLGFPAITGYGIGSYDMDLVKRKDYLAKFQFGYQGMGGISMAMVIGANSKEFCEFEIEDMNFEAKPQLLDVHCQGNWKVTGPIGNNGQYDIIVEGGQ